MLVKAIQHGEVLELSMQRPPVNALNSDLVHELNIAIQNAPQSSKALVISGREGLFSAGLDVPALMKFDRAQMTVFWRKFFGLLETLARSPMPIAAAITGHAPAGGAVMCLFCDYRVMSEGEFRIGLNETRVGLLVPEVIRYALIRLTGQQKAERLIVERALIPPVEAVSCGMLNAIALDPADTVSKAVECCKQVLTLPAHAMLGNRALMRKDIHEQFDSLGEDAVTGFVNGWFEQNTQDVLQAVVAQLKNKP
jgi:enoyl-CoA hydratase/carnithine racemase